MKYEITPGPWTADVPLSRPPKVFIKGKQGFIATLGYPPSGDREANAHLVAAAPDLLAACRKVQLAGHPDGDVFKAVTDAIAKAEGASK